MNIASSTWWMTTAFTFSQHAITTENKGAPPWNQVLLPHMSSGVLQSFRKGTDVLDAHAAAAADDRGSCFNPVSGIGQVHFR